MKIGTQVTAINAQGFALASGELESSRLNPVSGVTMHRIRRDDGSLFITPAKLVERGTQPDAAPTRTRYNILSGRAVTADEVADLLTRYDEVCINGQPVTPETAEAVSKQFADLARRSRPGATAPAPRPGRVASRPSGSGSGSGEDRRDFRDILAEVSGSELGE